MITPADEAAIRRLVGERSFARGRAYAGSGRVAVCDWDGPSRLSGQVQGTDRMPYDVSVTIGRSASGRLSSLTTVCTCPVGFHCKHAVALLLAPRGAPGRRAETPPAPARVEARRVARPRAERRSGPAWERPLAALLGGGEPARPATSRVGLQLEFVPAGTRGGPGIGLRPVALSPAGNWVRTGMAWDRLDYLYLGRHDQDRTGAAVGLLLELRAMSRAGSARGYWASRDGTIRLESVDSRRVWDLLGELVDLGAPLLLAGGGPGAVSLDPPAEVVLDLSRQPAGMLVEARYAVGGCPIPPGGSLLVGHPAHGVAWWEEPAGPGKGRLHLAPFARRPTEAERDLVDGGGLVVPKAQLPRFLAQVCPQLRRRVTVESSDGSVDLAALPPVSLILTVAHRPDHVVELSWHRGVPGSWREGLWDGGAGCSDPEAEEAIAAAAAITTKLAPLTEAGPDGDRIRAGARVAGMDAVVLVTDLLARLGEVPGLVIEEDGTPVDYRAAPEAPLVSLGGSASPTLDWFDLTVEVSVGGEPVAFQELLAALAQGHSHLILPSGTYFGLDSPELAELARLVAEARSLQDSPEGPVRLSRFQASLWEDLRQLGTLTGQAEAWGASVRGLVEATETADIPVPAGLLATLRPYQESGFRWLAFLYQHGLGGILADDMGLGKTLQALALVCRAREQDPAAAPFLVVAPTSVVGNWLSECRRFTPDVPAVALSETTARRGTALAEAVSGAGIVVTSYALFRLDYAEYERMEWAGLFLDEAQFVKNSASHAHRRARTLPVPFKLAMTGTPLENNLMELWSLLAISAPGLFPRSDRFNQDYRLPVERAGDAEALSRLRRRVRPLMLRRTKEQVATDLPDKQEQVLELDLAERHRRIYQTYLQRERQKVLGLLGDLEKNRFQIFRSLTLLRQASLDASLVDPKHARVPSTKLDTLVPMLEEAVAEGHRVLVFSQFTRFLTLARRRIQEAGIEHCYLDGRTRRRAEVIAGFREGRAPVFLISLKAGGFGLNLTEADHCILLDPWWNPATEAQAVDRVHRIGQTRKVMVHRLVARDTIEEKVMALKAKKAALFANVVDGGGFESAALTAEDIALLVSG